MKFTFLAYGSRGDIQPYLALALGLQQAGYGVRLAAPSCFADFVTGYGLDFVPLPGDPTRLVQGLVDRAGRNPLRTIQVVAEYALPLALQLLAEVRSACQGTDTPASVGVKDHFLFFSQPEAVLTDISAWLATTE